MERYILVVCEQNSRLGKPTESRKQPHLPFIVHARGSLAEDGVAVVVPVDDELGAADAADEPGDGERRDRGRVLDQHVRRPAREGH